MTATVGCASTAAESTVVQLGGITAYSDRYAFTFQIAGGAFGSYNLGSNYWKGLFVQSHVELGVYCPKDTTAMVVLTPGDYETLIAPPSVTTADVALLASAIMLVWAVAWLTKRAVRVLIPNA